MKIKKQIMGSGKTKEYEQNSLKSAKVTYDWEPMVDWFYLFVDLWVLPFPLEDYSVFGNFVITLI
jgi:hypothetical protein